jgi:hypothetical protein
VEADKESVGRISAESEIERKRRVTLYRKEWGGK